MYRRPKFLEMLLEIRREMALEADYDVDLFVGRIRRGERSMRGEIRESESELRSKVSHPSVLEQSRKTTKR